MDIKKISEKITLPVAIIIAAAVLAIGFYAVQYSKQKSIERQQTIKLQETKAERKSECSSIARAAFDSYKELRKNEDGSSNSSYGYEVFGYSPSLDTCIFSVEEILHPPIGVDSRIIVDAYTNREIVSWVVWHELIEETRKKEGGDSPVVANFDSEQKTNREIFQRIYNESF